MVNTDKNNGVKFNNSWIECKKKQQPNTTNIHVADYYCKYHLF